MSMDLKGLGDLNKALDKLLTKSDIASQNALELVLHDYTGKATEAAPVDNGDLRGDIAIPRKISKFHYRVGSSLPYALKQHEEIGYRHPRGGGAKYLEKPLRQNADKYIKYIKDKIKGGIE